jgi:hypothetical protein
MSARDESGEVVYSGCFYFTEFQGGIQLFSCEVPETLVIAEFFTPLWGSKIAKFGEASHIWVIRQRI